MTRSAESRHRPTASVVICAYTLDRWEALVAAVDSAQGQTYPPLETIVVVDHNRELVDRARRQLSAVTVVENVEPPGLGGARNSGVAAARGDVVVFLDDDALADRTWLEELIGGFRDPNVAGVGGSIEPLWHERAPRWFPDEFGWAVGCTYRGMPETVSPVRNLIGCNMSYRRDLLRDLGGFRLGYGCDETEFCIRLRQAQPETVLLYVPTARVRHQIAPGRATFRTFVGRCYFEGGSKAVVARLRGSDAALATERSYAVRTLPRGILRGVADAVVRRDTSGLARAATIVAGFSASAAGYLVARVAFEEHARRRGWSTTPGSALGQSAGPDSQPAEPVSRPASRPRRPEIG